MSLPSRLIEMARNIRRREVVGRYQLSQLLDEAAQALTDAPKPQAPLTPKQYDLLAYIKEYIITHGYAPKFDEIQERFKWRSGASVHEHLTMLEHKGYIARCWNKQRSITVLSDHAASPEASY